MKLALRLQRGEAFGPGGLISKFVLLESCVYNSLETKNQPTRDKTHSNPDPEA